MRAYPNPLVELNRVTLAHYGWAGDANGGAFRFYHKGVELFCIMSIGMGWEHVSVSAQNRCPTWEEMCFIKERFWDDEEEVVQFHPKKSEYVNFAKYCLHLWRPIDLTIPTPDALLVGPKKGAKYAN